MICEGEPVPHDQSHNASKKAGSQFGEAKYKGTYRLRIPNPQNPNAQYPESDVSRMNDMIFRFEKSNPGFHWDCDEKKLPGLIVGFRTQEDEYNGNVFTRIGSLATADDVRQGLVKGMSPRRRQVQQDPLMPTMPTIPTPSQIPKPVDSQTGMPVVDTDELPFSWCCWKTPGTRSESIKTSRRIAVRRESRLSVKLSISEIICFPVLNSEG